MPNSCLQTNNKEAGCHRVLIKKHIEKDIIKKEILELTPEQQNQLVRRTRDKFNKHQGLQLEIAAYMIVGKHINMENLDNLDIE